MLLKNILRKVLICLPLIISCNSTNADIIQVHPNLFVAGVPSGHFEYMSAPQKYGRQKQQNWCWAASTQMVLNYHGLFVSQEQIVQRIYGQQIDKPATPAQILHALSGWAPDNRGRFSSIHANPFTYSSNQIIHSLANRWPLIVGLRNPKGGIGHAVVLTGVYYSVDQFNNPVFHSVIIRDPWPNSPSKQELSWNEFKSRLIFMTHIYVNRL